MNYDNSSIHEEMEREAREYEPKMPSLTIDEFNNFLESVGITDTYQQDQIRAKYGHDLRTMYSVKEMCEKWNDPARAKDSLLKNASC